MRPGRGIIVMEAFLALSLMASAATPTQTSLTISPNSVATGTTVVLMAAVTSSGAPVHPGTVVFCNAAAAHCEDTAILGSAQLNSTGVARLAVRLAPKTYSIKAVFQATPHSATPRASSTSSVESLTVSGLSATMTGPLLATPGSGRFDLSTIVAGFGARPLTGSVTFQDSVNNGTPLTLSVESITSAVAQPQFTAPLSVPIPQTAEEVTIGDVNNDGLPDFLALNEYLYPNNYNLLDLVVILNNGDGTYKTVTQYFPTLSARVMTAGDVNNDGLLDIIVYDDIGRTLIPMLGDGHGHFTALSPVAVQQFPTSLGLHVADINGDGNLDVLLVSSVPGAVAEIFLGTGDGNLVPGPAISSPILSYQTILKDINGDGIPDIVTVDQNTFIIKTYLGNGDGTFSYKWESTPPIIGYAMASADFNGDGIPDLLTADGGNNVGHILAGNGDGTFTTSYTFHSAYGYLGEVGTGDFNGDGKPDAFFYSDLGGSSVQVALGKGDGTLEAPYTSIGQGTYYPSPLAVDVNGDGLSDILLNFGPTDANLYLSAMTKPASATSVVLGANLDHALTVEYSGSTYFAPSSATYDVITFPNVTSQLKFTSSGFLYSRPRHAYVGTITVTNISASAIAGTLQIGFTGLPDKVALLNPMVNKNEGFFTGPTGLAPGQSFSFPVAFTNPNNVAITYTLIAYTGAF